MTEVGEVCSGARLPQCPGRIPRQRDASELDRDSCSRLIEGKLCCSPPKPTQTPPLLHSIHAVALVCKLTSPSSSGPDSTIMLTRRVCASVRGILSPPCATAVRSQAFSAGAPTQSPARAPTLADITPDSAASFNEKQKSFRDGLVAAQKRKEQEESPLHVAQPELPKSANVSNYRRCPRP